MLTADGKPSDPFGPFWVAESIAIDAPTSSIDDPASASHRFVRFGGTLLFSAKPKFAFKAGDSTASFQVPPNPIWESSNPEAGSLNVQGLFVARSTSQNSTVTGRLGSVRSNSIQVEIVGIERVRMAQTAFVLNAAPLIGLPDAGFVTSLVATASSEGSLPINSGVSWTSSDPERVTVSPLSLTTARLETVRGGGSGKVTIKAFSIDDPSKFATASVDVTTRGGLGVEVQ